MSSPTLSPSITFTGMALVGVVAGVTGALTFVTLDAVGVGPSAVAPMCVGVAVGMLARRMLTRRGATADAMTAKR